MSEHIFLASEINQNMTIARINFNMTTLSVTPTINSYGNVALYLKTTASATLTTGTYSLAGYTPVYSGTMAWTAAGFDGVVLSTPFAYTTAAGNLQLLVVRTDNVGHAGPIFATANGNSTGAALTTSRRYNSTIAPTAGVSSLAASAFRTAIQLVPSCTGTPAPGNTLSSTALACSGGNFTLSLQNPTALVGITYQWQSADDAAFTLGVTNLGTAVTQVTSQTTAKYYRCQVSCSGGGTGTSTPVFIDMTTATAYCGAYCNPTYTTGKTDGDLISNVVIGGTTLANNSGSTPVNPAFTFFNGLPNYTANLQAGSNYNVTVTIGSFADQGVAVWIDYNDDGVFTTPGERVGFTATNIGTAFGSASFPIALACNPPLGLHRMRVRLSYATAGNTIDPCANYGWGETEDYVINVTTAAPCPQPSALTVTGVTPTTASLSWTLGCAETTWLVEYGPTGFTPGTGTVITVGVTNVTIPGLTLGLPYQAYVRADCGLILGQSAYGTPVSFTPNYCTASGTNGTFERLSNVTFGSINNNSTGTTGYENFSALSTCLFLGQSTPITIGVASAYATDDRVYVWIDTDQDGVFADPAELYFTEAVSTFCPTCVGTATVITGNVTLPGVLPTGNTRMRIRLQDNSSAPTNTTPCGVSAFGEVEDYTVNVQPAPTCLPTTGLGSTALSSTSASLFWTDNNSPSALSWQIEYGPEGFTPGTGTFVTSSTNPYTLGGLSLARYDFYVLPDCGSGPTAACGGAQKGKIILNDKCVGAVALTMGASCTPVLGSSANGTMDTPSCSVSAGATTNADVWFSFVATSSFGTIQVAPAAGAPAYYPTIELLTGVDCSLLSQVCCTFAGGAGQTLTVQKQLTIGQQYWMRIGHAFAGGSGNNEFNICVFQSTAPTGTCTFTGTPDLVEAEPCGSADNSACLLGEALPLNSMIPLSTYLVSGHVYGECNLRDIDYYTFTLTSERNIQFDLKAQFGSQLVMLDISAGCPGVQVGLTVTAAPCSTATLSQLLPAGTYAVFATTNAIFNNIPCGSSLTDYQLLITDLPVPTGACCALDGSCSELTASQCAANFGSYNGDGTLCVNVTCPQPLTCGDTYTDSGTAANPYSADENNYVKVCSNDPLNTQARVTFSAFDLEEDFDALYVYDGPTPTSPLISSGAPINLAGFAAGGWTGATIPGPFTSSDISGCLTFHFLSDGSGQNAGWEALVSCVAPDPCATPSAINVSNIAPNSVDVSWNCLFCGTPFYIEVGPVGFTPGVDNTANGGTVYTTTSSPFTVTGLTSGQSYEVVVRHDCGGGIYSSNSTAVAFATPPSCGDNFFDTGGASLDYDVDEDVTTTICATTPQDIVTVTFSAFATEDTYDALYVYDGPNISAPLISSGNPATLSGYPAGGYYGVAIPGPFTSTDLSGCLTFRFRSDFTVTDAGWEATVSCTTPPPCRVPTGVAVGSLTTSGGSVTWNCAGCTGSYIVEYGLSGFVPGTANAAGIGGTVILGATSPTALSGLASGTAYDVYVRQDCNNSSNGYGANSPVKTFNTLIDCSTAPVLNCFAPTTVNLSGVGQWNIVQCGQPTPGLEKIFQFNAPVAGGYTFEVLSNTGGPVDYFYKLAGACNTAGWTCITEFAAPGTQGIVLPTAGTYYILADAEGTAARSQSFRMICPPVNTTCSAAQTIGCFDSQTGNLVGANTLPPSACAFNGAASVGPTNWFVYTAAANEDVTFSVCNPGVNVRLNAFKATAAPDCSNLVCVGGADDSPGCAPGADLKVKANSGDVIYIAVSGVTGATGLYTLTTTCDAQCSPSVANDMCAGATDLNPLPYVGFGTPITDDNTCAYVDGPTGNSGAEPVQGLWYTFNSGVNSKIRMTLTAGTASNLKWALHSGLCDGLDAFSEVANGNASGLTILNVTPATDYRLVVFNTGGPGVQGTFTLNVEKPGINDASISAVLSPSGTICDTQFQPVVKLKNLGEATLTNVQITVKEDALTEYVFNWSGPALAFGDSVTLTLPLVTSTGNHVLNVNTDLPNGVADDIPSNDLASSAYQANGQTVKVRVTTDNNPGQTTWIIYEPGNIPVASGGPYVIPNNQSTTTICLPVTGGNTKWFFFLFDSFGDGICCSQGTGSWQVLDKLDRVIMRDNGQFTTQSPNTPPLTPAYSVGHEINLPIGPARPWTASPYNVCGVFNLGLQAKIRSTTVAGATAYQWEFSNPDAGYQRRVSATVNYVTYVSMQAQQPQLGVTYFVRNRADQGVAGFNDDRWGEGCELGWNNSNSQFCTGLVSTAGATFSCGATRTWGGSSKIWATPVVGAYPYDANGNGSFADAGDQQFAYHFRFVGAGGYIRDIYTATYICPWHGPPTPCWPVTPTR
ncbi:MAG: hypothetical protein IPP26_03870 [Flavobacteriales bacterium]|nr:hypothetical protein [Flavobacteriales bacterium]